MDGHKILISLIVFEEDTSKATNEEQLQEVLDSTFSSLSEDIKTKIVCERNDIVNSECVRWKYLHLILYAVKILLDGELRNENPLLNVDQFQIIQKTINVIVSIGILPSLSPKIKIYATTMLSKKYEFNSNDLSIVENHKILTYTVDILLECFDKTFLRPVLISHLDCMLGALLQLAHAPLKEPVTQNSHNKEIEFEMTAELFTQLKQEQGHYTKELCKFINNCPQLLLFKEFMVILGIKTNPKWLQTIIKYYLTDRIMQPDGITALALAICGDVFDVGRCWNKLDITSQLIATSHGSNVEKYFNSISTQILEMLNSKDKQKTIIANSCIRALYDKNPEICTEKFINPVISPFLVKYSPEKKYPNLIKTEEEVSKAIENLYELYITAFQRLPGSEFKCLPIKFLISVAMPIFQLHIKSYQSIFVLRNQVRELLLKILAEDSKRKSIFSAFLNCQELNDYEFGEKLNFCFGNNGGFEIISEPLNIEHEKVADCLYDLVEKNECLAFDLFTCLLKIMPGMNEIGQNADKGILIETPADTVDRIEKQLSAMKLLTLLSSSTSVQKAQLENPKPFLNFIKFYFSKITSNKGCSDQGTDLQEQDASILYTCLMFIKIILTDGNIKKTWEIFQDFIFAIKQDYDFEKVPSFITAIVDDIETIVKKKGKSYSVNTFDLSTDGKKLSEFDKAVADLADPLLPVRAHGIIVLTKLIERRHPEVTLKKDFLLCVFQENLNDDDSFIYLAAINGLCALSSMFPDAVIEILVQEFIGMTQGNKNKEIPPETRTKLGEILVKTTRALGEMTPKYKNLLINGFLSGSRDPDPLVRASSLSCLGEFCKIMGFRLGNLITEILYCIGCIIKTDKDDGCRRAGVLVATLLVQGLGKDVLTSLGENLITLYRSLKHLRDNDKDPTLKLHAQLALEEFDDIVQKFLFEKPKMEKSIFLLPNNN